MKARISNLCRTEAEWCTVNFTPINGEFVIYAPDKNFTYARVKIGDGKTPLHLLPFFTEASISSALDAYKQAAISDAGRISDYF